MLRIAVCDDASDIRWQLARYFERFEKESGIGLQVDSYESGAALLTADYTVYDLLILDVQMGAPNGIETARRIRWAGGDMTIVFFTSYLQYALEGYEVQAFRFLLKPLSYEQFSIVVGQALTQMHSQRTEYIRIHQKDSTIGVPLEQIMYAETERGHIALHTKKHECIQGSLTMKELENELISKRFFRCHTAYLVNLREIKKVTQQDVILLDDTAIPLSKHRRKDMKEALAQFWGDQFL